MGHRNPHHISFAQVAASQTVAIVAEAGRDNIEEINVLIPGGDYGWSDREGTFNHNKNGGPNGLGYGLDYGVSALPANDWQLNDYIYPAAQYDHDAPLGASAVGIAVADGFVIDNHSDPELQNKYIFADFPSRTGWVFMADLSDLINAHTQLADGELPDALTQAPISRLRLSLDSNGDGNIDFTSNNLNTLLGVSRNDVRFGKGPNGEMFISSKATGRVYLVTNTVPPLIGDLNNDGFVGLADLGIILSRWNQNVTPGQWSSGDPSGDGFVGIDDLNEVLGNWNAGTPPSNSANIPEPTSAALILLGTLGVMTRCSGRRH